MSEKNKKIDILLPEVFTFTVGGFAGGLIGYLFFPGILDTVAFTTFGGLFCNSFVKMIKSIKKCGKNNIKTNEEPPLTIPIKKTSRPKYNEPD